MPSHGDVVSDLVIVLAVVGELAMRLKAAASGEASPFLFF
jgi:hypothetical protein